MLEILKTVSGFVWGPAMLILILGVGLILTVRIRGKSITKIPYAFKLVSSPDSHTSSGQIAPFSALMMALSATIGTGNIAGVATAITLGGPGALFWMWMSALIGMATKYGEAVCAVKFREKSESGAYVGGPMYYIKNGLPKHWHWLAILFAIFGAAAGFGIGNTVQVNSVASTVENSFGVNPRITAFILFILVGLVIIGGVRRIANFARVCVPVMAITYLVCGLAVIFANISELPTAFFLVVEHAFTPTAAQGGFAGATVAMAIQFGIARGVFSNESGLGSAPIAHAAAATKSPVKQGTIAMLGTFIDTIVVCSITGFAILVTGVWTGDAKGAAMSQEAFNTFVPFGSEIVSITLAVFAFTTIVGWSYYSERCMEFLIGHRSIMPFRMLWVACVPLGALLTLEAVWIMADILNGLMAIPNLIALLLLSGVIAKLTKEHFKQ